MASNSPANPDLPRQQPSSIHSFSVDDIQGNDQSKTFGSMNMDEILRNIYSDDAEAFPEPDAPGAGSSSQVGNKTVDEVWKEIVAGGRGRGSREPEMTLEDFLTKAGAVEEDDVRIPVIVNGAQFGGYGVDSVGFGNGIEGTMVAVGASIDSSSGVGRGKRRVVEEPQMDKVIQQKHRRMIKNRESAARSRERKQAYTVELESLVTQLEEENSRLLRDEAEHSKERFKQLMDNLIPVVEQRRPPRSLRRMHSMCW